jgi:hypothetical protein
VGSNLGVIIGVIVLLVSIGFVVLMMVGEWSESGKAMEAEVSSDVSPVRSAAPASKRAKKAAPKAPKKKAAKKSKKK